jgi:hypothetical protein
MRFTRFPPEGRRSELSLSAELKTSMKTTGLFAKVFTPGARNPSFLSADFLGKSFVPFFLECR